MKTHALGSPYISPLSLSRKLPFLLMTAVILALVPGGVSALPNDGNDSLDPLVFVSDRLAAPAILETVEEVEADLEPGVRAGWESFLANHPGEWRGYVDLRHGRIVSVEGAGIPFVPGSGNHLTREQIAGILGDKETPDLETLDRLARSFLARVAPLLGVQTRTLELNAGRSGSPSDHLWFVDYDVRVDGLPVEGARVVFRVNHGNLVQLGSENLPSLHTRAPKATVSREQSLANLTDFIGGFVASDSFVDNGTLLLLPVATEDPDSGQGFAFGRGRDLIPAWQFIFRRDTDLATWRARIDAVTGQILELRDINDYAQVTGGVKLHGGTGSWTAPMPFTDLSSGGYTNSAGIFSFGGGSVITTLNGRYVRILDDCGSIFRTSNASGSILLSSSPGTDCSTPALPPDQSGPGNTNASRTTFYHLNRGKEIARGWLPGNTWLSGQLTARVNLADSCAFFRSGSEIHFYRSGAGCSNPGEIEGIVLHEYAHALDSNDGSGAADSGTGETYADFTTALITHDSCVGKLFWFTNCGGYGDACTACTGFRDIDWARHALNTPHTVSNFTQLRCSGSNYIGPCGREAHCESQISSEALWDLVQRDLPSPGSPAAWAVAERLWYLSRGTATAAFTCVTNTNPWTSHGCGIGSLWKTLRAVDDDDGNLANGTPRSPALYAAFNRHGIACTTDPGANTSTWIGPPPPAPTLTVSGGDNQARLTWSGWTTRTDIYRSERGCNTGFTRIASNIAGESLVDTAWIDYDVAAGFTYSYQAVSRVEDNSASFSDPSTCQTVTLPVYEGFVDSASCSWISGWAWDQTRPNTSISVDIYKDGTKLTTVPANSYRWDLYSAGKGNGYHGFGYTPGSALKDGSWHSVAMRFGDTARGLTSSPRNLICGASLFPNLTPATPSFDTSGLVYTVATQLSSSHSGWIRKLGFRKASGETGTNVLRLWSDNGVELASVTPTCDGSGWCWGNVSVSIQAGVRYRVSVNTNTRQAWTEYGLLAPITNGPLTAHAGYWSTGNVFPTIPSTTNFFVDVAFDL